MPIFKSFDAKGIGTNHECPKCGYSWQGNCEGEKANVNQTSLLTEEDFDDPDDEPETVLDAEIADVAPPERRETVPWKGAQTRLEIVDEKPPYSVPTMSEIAAVPRNGLRVASTFSGAGGSSLGFRLAGWTGVYASEFVPEAAETYTANFDVQPDPRDVREVQPEDVLAAAGVDVGELDCLEGSPPCASFSTSGKREKLWGQEKDYSGRRQRTDDLFAEFARLLRGVQPRAFVAENVAGLLGGVARGYFKEIFGELESCGYRVEVRLLDAKWLGVPQSRRRVIFIGTRRDLGLRPEFPEPLAYQYSIRDALGDLLAGDEIGAPTGLLDGEARVRSLDEPAATVTADGGRQGPNAHQQSDGLIVAAATKAGLISLDDPAPTVLTHGNEHTHSEFTAVVVRKFQGGDVVDENTAPSMEGYAIGDEWERLRVGESSNKYLNLSRPDPDRPVPTVTALGGTSPGGVASVAHPFEKRKFTIRELKRLCSFPDDFILTGSYAQQWERLGRSVPPLMMERIARRVAETLS